MQSNNLKTLQKVWYAKLAEEGFEDIEQEDGMLKEWHSFRFASAVKSTNAPVTQEAKQEYYRLAGQFCHTHTFASNLEKDIWLLHSEGISIRQIITKLRKEYEKIGLSRNKVHGVIKELTRLMLKEARRETE